MPQGGRPSIERSSRWRLIRSRINRLPPIQLNERVPLRQRTKEACLAPDIATSGPSMAKPPGDHIPLVGFVLTCGSTPMANKRPDYDAVFERRAKGRTTINRDALLFFEGRNEVHACFVRDVTNEGAGMRL